VRPRIVVSLVVAVASAFVAVACGSESAELTEQPGTVIRPEVGERGPTGPCDSWLGPGVAAAYCAGGREAPAPTGDETQGQLQFTGLEGAGASGGIAQGMGPLPEGEAVRFQVQGETTGTLLAQGLCEGMKIKAAFYDQHFADGTKGAISIHRAGDVPVILLAVNGESIAPDREIVWELQGPSSESEELCAFA
jgi:hypothetical protein